LLISITNAQLADIAEGVSGASSRWSSVLGILLPVSDTIHHESSNYAAWIRINAVASHELAQ